MGILWRVYSISASVLLCLIPHVMSEKIPYYIGDTVVMVNPDALSANKPVFDLLRKELPSRKRPSTQEYLKEGVDGAVPGAPETEQKPLGEKDSYSSQFLKKEGSLLQIKVLTESQAENSEATGSSSKNGGVQGGSDKDIYNLEPVKKEDQVSVVPKQPEQELSKGNSTNKQSNEKLRQTQGAANSFSTPPAPSDNSSSNSSREQVLSEDELKDSYQDVLSQLTNGTSYEEKTNTKSPPKKFETNSQITVNNEKKNQKVEELEAEPEQGLIPEKAANEGVENLKEEEESETEELIPATNEQSVPKTQDQTSELDQESLPQNLGADEELNSGESENGFGRRGPMNENDKNKKPVRPLKINLTQSSKTRNKGQIRNRKKQNKQKKKMEKLRQVYDRVVSRIENLRTEENRQSDLDRNSEDKKRNSNKKEAIGKIKRAPKNHSTVTNVDREEGKFTINQNYERKPMRKASNQRRRNDDRVEKLEKLRTLQNSISTRIERLKEKQDKSSSSGQRRRVNADENSRRRNTESQQRIEELQESYDRVTSRIERISQKQKDVNGGGSVNDQPNKRRNTSRDQRLEELRATHDRLLSRIERVKGGIQPATRKGQPSKRNQKKRETLEKLQSTYERLVSRIDRIENMNDRRNTDKGSTQRLNTGPASAEQVNNRQIPVRTEQNNGQNKTENGEKNKNENKDSNVQLKDDPREKLPSVSDDKLQTTKTNERKKIKDNKRKMNSGHSGTGGQASVTRPAKERPSSSTPKNKKKNKGKRVSANTDSHSETERIRDHRPKRKVRRPPAAAVNRRRNQGGQKKKKKQQKLRTSSDGVALQTGRIRNKQKNKRPNLRRRKQPIRANLRPLNRRKNKFPREGSGSPPSVPDRSVMRKNKIKTYLNNYRPIHLIASQRPQKLRRPINAAGNARFKTKDERMQNLWNVYHRLVERIERIRDRRTTKAQQPPRTRNNKTRKVADDRNKKNPKQRLRPLNKERNKFNIQTANRKNLRNANTKQERKRYQMIRNREPTIQRTRFRNRNKKVRNENPVRSPPKNKRNRNRLYYGYSGKTDSSVEVEAIKSEEEELLDAGHERVVGMIPSAQGENSRPRSSMRSLLSIDPEDYEVKYFSLSDGGQENTNSDESEIDVDQSAEEEGLSERPLPRISQDEISAEATPQRPSYLQPFKSTKDVPKPIKDVPKPTIYNNPLKSTKDVPKPGKSEPKGLTGSVKEGYNEIQDPDDDDDPAELQALDYDYDFDSFDHQFENDGHSSNSTDQKIAFIDYSYYTDLIEELPCRCGVPPANRIIGGKATNIQKYPWMVQQVYRMGDLVYCGGTIINDRYVLTASHCVVDTRPDEIYIRIGHTSSDDPGVTLGVESFIMHRRYNDGDISKYDIALIKLNQTLTFSDRVLPICLPTRKYFNQEPGFITGWGTLAEYGDETSDVLQAAQVKIMEYHTCRKESSYDDIDLNKLVLCAKDENVDSCQGDSGGPLVYFDGESYSQVGITSWGIGCGKTKYPGIYTKVVRYYKWIFDRTRDAQYCKSSSEKKRIDAPPTVEDPIITVFTPKRTDDQAETPLE